jgi:hypothetical protein
MATVQQKDAHIIAASAASAPRAGTISRWEQRLQQAVIVLGRLGLGLLFLTQLGSKLPRRSAAAPTLPLRRRMQAATSSARKGCAIGLALSRSTPTAIARCSASTSARWPS